MAERKDKYAKWQDNLDKLKAYKEEHGSVDIEISKVSEEQRDDMHSLQGWLRSQRLHLYKAQNGKPNSLTEEQRTQLTDLGVEPCDRVPIAEREHHLGNYTFDQLFEKLEKFKEVNGHVEVPVGNRKHPEKNPPEWSKALVSWNTKLRENFVKFRNGETQNKNLPGYLDSERIARLSKIGFRFEVNRRETWDYRAAEWLTYYSKNGTHPTLDESPVGRWVRRTRHNYWLKQEDPENYKGPLTDERVEKLRSWGFDFGRRLPKEVLQERKGWEERFQELVEYKEQHGNVDVPQSIKGLGTWVHHQRRHYRHLKRGESGGPLTKERIERLVALGFKWITRKSPAGRSKHGLQNQNLILDFAAFEQNQPEGAVACGNLLGASTPPVARLERARPQQDDSSSSSEEDDDHDDDEEEEEESGHDRNRAAGNFLSPTAVGRSLAQMFSPAHGQSTERQHPASGRQERGENNGARAPWDRYQVWNGRYV